jgi:hypothetical protein
MSNSAEVAATIDNMNRRNIEPLPLSMRRAAEAYKIYVFSVSPESYTRTIGVGTFIVPAKEKGQRISRPLVFPATHYTTVITETGPMRWVPSEGMDIAKDILQLGQLSDYSKYGLFISMNEDPSEEEIAAAEESRVNHLAKVVEEGDGFYAVNGGMTTVTMGNQQVTRSNISVTHRNALKELGWERPWGNNKAVQMASCWNCGRSVLPASAKCFNDGCGAPLKDEDAKARFMAGDFEEPRRGRQRAS